MNKYEELLEDAAAANIDVYENLYFKGNIKGLYADHSIGLSDRLRTTVEKTTILAEELGHHYTSAGNILDQTNLNNKKQEMKARIWSYQRLVSLKELIDAYEHGYRDFHEVAEYLEVAEEVLRDAISSYRSKYGITVTCGDYYIMFEPYLTVGKRL